jgi:sugar phosphate permease
MTPIKDDEPGGVAGDGPTLVRHLVVFATFLTAVLLYLDRFCMNYAQRYVKEDLGLSDRELGWCMSAFFLSYALAQVPSGWLTDRYGARLMLTVYILAWSFFTAAMGWVSGLVMLLMVRLAAGLGQAGAYPTAAAVVGRWVPLYRRGLASSLIAMGGRVGAATAPILTAYLTILFVPADTPATLTAADVSEVRALSHTLFRATLPLPTDGAPPAEEAVARREIARRLWETFNPSAQAAVQRLAEQDAEAAGALTESEGETRAALMEAFSDAIPGPLLGTPALLATLPLEREAQRALAEDRTLSETERARVNRLILEAVFPDNIRKLYVRGWRPVMFVYGALGILVAGFYYVLIRNRPQQHPWVNARELDLIQAGRTDATVSSAMPVGAVPMRAILASGSLWLISIAQFGTNVGWVFLVTWLPRYLLDVHQVPFEQRGWMASIPMFVGWAGMLCGGWWTDRLTRRIGPRWGRALPLSSSRFLAMAAFLLVMLEPSPWTATLLFAAVAFGTDLGSPAVWAFNQDVGGRYIASVLGWGNMWGNLGATVSPILLEAIVRHYGGSWNAAFLTCAGAFFIAGVCGLAVDARRSIDAPDGTAGP